MSAVVTRNPVRARTWTAYCEECSDGINGPRAAAEDWADTHNDNRHHPIEETP